MSPCDPTFDLAVTYISWSSDFALYLENFSMVEHHIFGIMNQHDPTSDLKIFVGHRDLYFMVY